MTNAPIILRGAVMVDPHEYTAADVNFEVIGKHLADIIRWNGATEEQFSVAEHSLYMADLLELDKSRDIWLPDHFRRMRLCVLLHDAHEALVGDAAAWLKESVPEIGGWCKCFDRAIYEAAGVGLPNDTERIFIKQYDAMSAAREIEELFPEGPNRDALQKRHQDIYGVGVPRMPLYRADSRRDAADYWTASVMVLVGQ